MIVSKTITARMIRGGKKKPTQVENVLSLLPSDYRNLINLPTINGVEVSGDLTVKELNLLPSKPEDYSEHELGSDKDDGKYFVLVGEDQTMAKVPAQTVAKTLSIIKTAEDIDENMDVGAYRFVEKKRGN